MAWACATYGWTDRLSPIERIAPLLYNQKHLPFRADGNVEAFLSDQVVAIQLYNQRLGVGMSVRKAPGPAHWDFEPGSFLWQQAIEIGLPRTMAWRR